MIIWLVLYALSGLTQDSSIEEYCFTSPAKMKQVSARLKFILVPVDKVQEHDSCFTVSTPPHRRELIQSYVRRIEPSAQIGFSSAEIKREPCHIKVEKEKAKTIQNSGANADSGPSVTAAVQDISQNGIDVTRIQTLKEFELTVNQDTIKGECHAVNEIRYDITIEVRKDAVPLLPPVPRGTIVIIPDAQIPKVQETSKLQTTLQLNRGERIEIGSIVRNLKNNSKKIDVNSGAGLEIKDEEITEKVFLTID